MYEYDLFRRRSLDVIDEAFPVAVRAEPESFHLAAQGFRLDVRRHLKGVPWFGGTQPARGRVRVGESDKEDAVGRVGQEMRRDDV